MHVFAVLSGSIGLRQQQHHSWSYILGEMLSLWFETLMLMLALCHDQDRCMFYSFFAGAMACLSFSAISHCCYAHSPKLYSIFMRFVVTERSAFAAHVDIEPSFELCIAALTTLALPVSLWPPRCLCITLPSTAIRWSMSVDVFVYFYAIFIAIWALSTWLCPQF